MANPFADSIYAQPGLTQMVRQYDRNPGRGETLLTATASPSPAALTAENNSVARVQARATHFYDANGNVTGTLVPKTTRAELTSNSDVYRNIYDSTTINRNYTG